MKIPRYIRSLCMALILVLLVQMLPLSVFAQEYSESASSSDAVADKETEDAAAYVVEEMAEKRTEYSKEFRLSNGLHMTAVYMEPVHYERSGNWEEIDNTLKAVSAARNSGYRNTAGVWDVRFPGALSGENAVTITKDGYTLGFFLSGELREGSDSIEIAGATLGGEKFAVRDVQTASAKIQKVDLSAAKEAAQYPELVSEKAQSRLQYTGVYDGTDIIYDLEGNRVKESVVMQAYSSGLRGYCYTLNVGELTPVLTDSNEIHLYDKNRKEVVMAMPAPFLVDGAGEYCGDVKVVLTGSGSTYTLAYLLPQSWLADSQRQYPVVLDPVVCAGLDPNNIRDCTVGSEQDMGQQDGSLRCGWQKYFGALRTYIKYAQLPSLTSADVIVGATMSLYSMADNTSEYPISVHKVLGSWESETITYKTAPAFDPTVEDYAYVPGQGLYYWDVTDLVRGWYSGSNTGMMFKAPESIENSTTNNYKKFYSSDYSIYQTTEKPTLLIYFRNNNGLESYWDYTTASAGRAGTGYVNDYTGNLVWVRGDIGFGGNRMPVSISHVYNANDSQNNNFSMGYGWRTNFNQLVYQWDQNSSYYVWEDGDGTRHYFHPDEGQASTYCDEDGLELTLTTNGSGTGKYRIKDKNGNTSYFDTNGRLTKQENNQQTKSSITITYAASTGKQISKITDGAGRSYSFTYANNLLSRIGYKGSGSSEISYVTFGYTGSKLTSVTDKDGKSCAYSYGANNLLTAAQDIDGYKLTYTYNTTTAGQPNRVATVKEYDGSALGGELAIAYAHNQTTFTDHNGNKRISQFNNWGNTVSVQDGEGRAQYGKYAADTASSGKGNQLIMSSKLQNTVGNLLPDSSFESGTAWTPLSAAATSAIISSGASVPAYLGNKLLKVTASAAGVGVSGGTFSVPAGSDYTFSAYVKTGSASAYLAITDGSAVVKSESLAPGSGWTRLEVTYTNNTAAAKAVSVQVITQTAGTVYVDCAQVEKAPTASRYNILQNGDFRSGSTGWTASANCGSTETCVTASSAAAPQLDASTFRMVGNPKNLLRICQNVAVSGSAGDTFVLSGWAMGDAVPLSGHDSRERTFSLRGVFVNTDGTETDFTFHFNPDAPNTWQYAAGVMVAKKPYSSVKVYCLYDYNANTVYFDGIQLYKEAFGSSYTYDENGNVVSVKDLQGQTTSYEYTNNNLTKAILPTGAKLTYTYDTYHNVLTATSEEGQVYTFTYDTYGNNTSVSIVNGSSRITTTAAYTADGNRMVSATDALGKTTTYSYSADTNILEWVRYPEDTAATRTNYTYDSMYRMASAAVTTDTGLALSAHYTYTDDYLTKIETASTAYDFSYGDFGLRSSIRIGSRTLASYSYTSRNNYLASLDYGNGDRVQYTYDKQGRITKQTYEDGDTVTYKYDNSGALATVTDSATGRTTTYYYDFTDRLMKYVESGSGYSHSVGYEYDTINNLTKLVETINGVTHTTSYAYDDDNRVTQITTDGVTKSYTYDAYGRVSKQVTTSGGATVLTETYTYTTNSAGQPSTQVAAYRTQSALYDVTYTYTYDDNGNILSVSDGTNTTSYVYDSANQLIRENDQAAGKTTTWDYDNAGNILSRKEFAYTTGELGSPAHCVDYTYGDSAWGDLLTEYDNRITYDAIGNPLRDYQDNTYTWEHGRQLASYKEDGNELEDIFHFVYDANGMRAKVYNAYTTYSYVYNGDSLAQMEISNTSTGAVNHSLSFTYDANGAPQSVTYNGTTYFYATNLQGDVVAILNSSGTAVVEYTYNAWGKPLSVTGSMASTLGTYNPLRYRGYVYDIESGLYYLQSRYYNPETGRFINADSLTSAGQGVLGHNMFAYCGNDPCNYFDTSGTSRRAVGAGIQIEVSGGSGVSGTAGIEIIVYWDTEYARATGNPEIAIYSYGGASIDFFETAGIVSDVKDILIDNVDLLKVDGCSGVDMVLSLVKSSLSADVSASGVLVMGEKSFTKPEDYEGGFKAVSANVWHFKGAYAWSSKCRAISVGVSVRQSYGISYSKTSYSMITNICL